MSRELSRGDFLNTASGAALTLGNPWNSILADDIRRLHAAGSAPRLKARAFELHDVRLLPGIQLTGLRFCSWRQ